MIVDASTATRAAIGLLPVLCFLAALLVLDSYKLVRLRMIVFVIAIGCIAAGASYLVNFAALRWLGLDFGDYSQYGAPFVEEAIKGIAILLLIRTHRIGFLVDASIFGFAVGAGFAMIENLYYLNELADHRAVSWIVRGFGTAILHGGVQAIFAAMVLANTDRRGAMDFRAVVPPLIVAVLVHSAFNHFVLPPIYQTLLVLLGLPPLMLWVFARSERALEGWIGTGFDSDRELIELLDSGTFSESPTGQYLHGLRARFSGPVIADMVCYLRLCVELALRAKGILMMRENGIEMAADAQVDEKLEEMRYLERSIGPTGLRTLQPLLRMSRRDRWQLYMLGK
ncbi:MAG: PrsW family glutamic-type intramembrane protease [Lysobacteraceae bacterium]